MKETERLRDRQTDSQIDRQTECVECSYLSLFSKWSDMVCQFQKKYSVGLPE